MLHYNGTTIGTITIKQRHQDKDYKYTLQIRQGNCLAVVIYVRKATKEELKENPEGKWYHQLYTFYSDEQHMKNIIKEEGDIFFGETVTDIHLNLYYKECKTLLKYFTLSGHEVTCYYAKPEEK